MKQTIHHIAIIMDGNGRWATKQNLARAFGHKKGAETLKLFLNEIVNLPFKSLTLFALSEDNLSRPREEVDLLFFLMESYLRKELNKLIENKVKIRIIGEESYWSQSQKDLFYEAAEKTKNFNYKELYLAFCYSSQQEIFQAMKKSQDYTQVEQFLYMPHALDLVIRTGGDQRLSNFLLWQSSYAELYFTQTLWPDFSEEEFRKILKEVELRERRFGKLP